MVFVKKTAKIVNDECEIELLSSLEDNLKRKRFPPLVEDDIVGVMERFVSINREFQRLIWKGGFRSGNDQDKMLEVAKCVFREKHFKKFWFGGIPEYDENVYYVLGSDPRRYAYEDHCLIFVTNMARKGARYSKYSKFMELRSGRVVKQPSFEKFGRCEDCLPDSYWNRFTRSMPKFSQPMDVFDLDGEDVDMSDCSINSNMIGDSGCYCSLVEDYDYESDPEEDY